MPAPGNRQLYAPRPQLGRGLRDAPEPELSDATPDDDDLAPYARFALAKIFADDEDFCLLPPRGGVR